MGSLQGCHKGGGRMGLGPIRLTLAEPKRAQRWPRSSQPPGMRGATEGRRRPWRRRPSPPAASPAGDGQASRPWAAPQQTCMRRAPPRGWRWPASPVAQPVRQPAGKGGLWRTTPAELRRCHTRRGGEGPSAQSGSSHRLPAGMRTSEAGMRTSRGHAPPPQVECMLP